MDHLDRQTERRLQAAADSFGAEQTDLGEELDERGLDAVVREDIDAGFGEPIGHIVLTGELDDCDHGLSVEGTGFDHYSPPRWLRQHIQAEHSPEVVIEEIQKRVFASPSELSLREAELVLNDFARLRGGAELVRRAVTQEVVDRLTQWRKER
jgi:hypothetical protein